MKTLNLVQGSPEWIAHRKSHFNASDAPAMMGCSPYETRSQLIHRLSSGQVDDVDPATQRRFDEGHRIEALARPLAEKIIGEDIYPVVGSVGRYSASFDGLTMAEDTAFEHKTLNDGLRYTPWDEGNGAHLPAMYRIQMEQQLMVSGAERCLFMASKWNGFELMEERHCWYVPDLELRAQIVAGWEQLAQDVADYTPPAEVVPVVGRTPENLPALAVEVVGQVVRSNALAYKAHALEVFKGINRTLETDQDFADAEKTVKWCEEVESRAKAAKEQIIGQTADIAEVLAVIEAVVAESASVRLELGRLVTARKQFIKNEIQARAQRGLDDHRKDLEARFSAYRISLPAVAADFGGAMKSKRTIESLQNAVDTVLARAKVELTAAADLISRNLVEFEKLNPEERALVPDLRIVISKQPDDFAALLESRLSAHKLAKQVQQAQEAAQQVAAAPQQPAPVSAIPRSPAPVAGDPEFVSPPIVKSVPAASKVREDLNAHLDTLDDMQLSRVLSFVQSRYPIQEAA